MLADLTAVDARQLQSSGVPQDERLRQAVERCNAAIADTARNQNKSEVAVLVFKLQLPTLLLLVRDLRDRGFQVSDEFRDVERSVVTINWEKDHHD